MITYQETALFCEQMSMILSSGLNVEDGLETIIDEIENGEFKDAISKIKEELSNGSSFYKASLHVEVFDHYYLEMVNIGEKTGYLEQVMEQCALYYKRMDTMQHKIKEAIFYPMLLLVMMIALMGVLVGKILPVFRDVLNSMGVDLTAESLLLMNVGQIVAQYGFAILLGGTIIVVVIYAYFRIKYKQKAFNKFLSSFWLTKKLMLNVESSKIAYALSLQINSGLKIKESVSLLTVLVENEDLVKKVNLCLTEMENGKEEIDALVDSKLLKKLYTRMIRIGFKAGKLDETMIKVASEYEIESTNSINRFLNGIEPAIMMSCVVIVGVILLSVMLPLMSIMTTLSS